MFSLISVKKLSVSGKFCVYISDSIPLKNCFIFHSFASAFRSLLLLVINNIAMISPDQRVNFNVIMKYKTVIFIRRLHKVLKKVLYSSIFYCVK